ncbi:MAG: glutamate 5-kinase [Acidimicrobiia bacterium]|jgi:glutamate 5-kinase
MRRPVAPGAPVVVKVGSSSLARPGGGLDTVALDRVIGQVADSWTGGHPTVLVSSGAVAAGLTALGRSSRPTDIPGLQVAAAVGQSRLMERYTVGFERRGLVAGQVLLTKNVLADRDQYLHARQALDRMLSERIVPVVNENDTVAIEELRLGDNDRLAALVSHLVGAGLLVLLTDTTGLFSAEPGAPGAELLDAVRHTDRVLDLIGAGRSGPLGSGGVATKVAAARMAAWSGVPTVVAAASEERVVERAMSGEPVGTWVDPQPGRLPARKLWIAFGQPAVGTVTIDDGAVDAIVRRGRSLLAVGVRTVSGTFDAGDAVEVLDERGSPVAKGIVRVSSALLQLDRPSERSRELIHRDDLVVLVAS